MLLEVNCKPGKGAEFVALLSAALVDTRARHGAGAMEPYVDSDNPDRVLVWEKWATRAVCLPTELVVSAERQHSV